MPQPNRSATSTDVKAQIASLFGHAILKEANRQIDLAATMPGAEEVALFDRMGALIRGEDERFDLIVFDTAPTGHTLRLIRMPELMEAWIKALSRSRRAMLGVEQDDRKDPIMLSLGDRLERLRELRARLMSGRTTGVRPGADPRAAADRRDRARDRAARRGRRPGRRLVVNRVLPAATADPFLNARRRQERVYLDEIEQPLRVAPGRARAAARIGRLRHARRSSASARAVSVTASEPSRTSNEHSPKDRAGRIRRIFERQAFAVHPVVTEAG